ncbi:MAG TPA: hypothetical protein PLB32_21960, partial [Acidobacteriota bacterium]|nr:hypothetical protein [Acidobacteriota bacterium]
MYQPILKAKNQRQHGSLLFNCLIWLLILGIFMWAILTFSTIAMRKVGERKDAVVLSTVSQNAAPKDLESAVFVYLDFLPLQFQAYFSKQFGKFGPTLDAIDQLCKQKFPLYDQLELRGATLARNSAFANLQSDINKIYGNATIMIQYDGVYHTETIPGNTLDPSEYPYTIALTCTVPYKLAKFRTDIPEDGDGTNRLGSAWRPVRAVST